MKFSIYFLTAAVALGSLVACSSSPKAEVNVPPAPVVTKVSPDSLTTPKARYSYALGMDMGRALKNVDADVDKEILLRSVRDQMEGNKVLMTEADAEKALQELLVEIQAQKEKKAAAASQKAIADQNAFLAKNKMDSGVVTTASGLQYKILTPGTGLSPKGSDKVSVHYTGSLMDGTEFDSSIKRGEPLEFPVDAVIQGWQEMLSLMKEGMKVKAWIPSSLGYGTDGASPVIPPNALLIFEVELLKVMPEPGTVDTTAKTTAVKPTTAVAKADTTKKVVPATKTAPAAKVDTVKTAAVKPAAAKSDTTKKAVPATKTAPAAKVDTAKTAAVKPAAAKADTTKKVAPATKTVAPAAKVDTAKTATVKPSAAKTDTTKKVVPATKTLAPADTTAKKTVVKPATTTAKADTTKATTVKK
jgi:FKBP-type peptidyl-prolyl cis-trans isomerase